MAQTVELGIKINVDGNKAAVDGIDQVTAATNRMGASAENVSQSMAAAQTNLGNSTAQLTVGQLRFLDSLRDQAAAAGLSKTELLEMQAAQMGLTDVSAGLIAQIDAVTASHKSFSLASAGATRELAVMGREIASGNIDRLAGSMTVLASRTGMLPMLFSPVGLGILAIGAAIVAFGVAEYEGAQQQEALRQALDITGNMAGLTEDKVNSMAQSMANIGNAGASKAGEILTGLAASGRFTSDTFEATGKTAVAFAQATGASSDAVVKEFVKMADNVVGWAEEHNKQYHAMTASDMDYVRQLVAQGDTAEAIRVVMQAFYGDFSGHVKNVGMLEGAWNKLANAAKGAWQAMMNMGKDQTLGEQLANLQKQIDAGTDAVNGRYKGSTDSGNGKIELDVLRANLAQMSALKAQAAAQDTAAAVQAEKTKHDQIQEQGAQAWAKIVQANRSRHEQMIDEIEAVTVAAQQAGIGETALAEEKSKIIAKYADNTAVAQIDAQQKAAEALREISLKSEADDINAQLKRGQIAQTEFDAAMTNNALEVNASKQQYEQAMLQVSGLDAKQRQAHEQELTRLKAVDDQIQNSGVNKYLIDQQSIYDSISKSIEQMGATESSQLDAAIAKQKQHNAEIGQTALQKELVLQQIAAEKMAESQSYAQYLRDMIASNTLDSNALAIDMQLLNVTEQKIEKRRQLIALKTQGAALDAAVEQKKVDTQQFKDAITAAKQMETELTTSFGNIGTAIGKMATAFVDYGKTQHDIQTRLKAETDAAYNDDNLKQVALNKANLDSASAQIKQYGDIAGAAAQFFDKNSKGYAVMQDVEKAYRLLEMALTAESLAKKLFSVNAETSAVVDGEAAKGDAATGGSVIIAAANWVAGNTAASAGVAAQASGDPYTAWARMAAMAAVMVGLGYVVSGSGGSAPDPNSAAQQQATQGTGTVMGDAKKQSDSIVASLKLLVSNSGELLPLTSQMAASLQSIVSGISGVANILSGNPVSQDSMGITTGKKLSSTGLLFESLNKLDAALGGIGGKIAQLMPGLTNTIASFLFGSSSSSVTDTGLSLSGTVGQLAQGNGVNDYANVQTTTKGALGGLFGGNSTSDSTVSQTADAQTKQTFALIFSDLESTFTTAATAIGANATAVGNAVAQIPIQTNISLQGLTGTALTTALQAVLSKQTDLITQSLVSQNLLPNLNAFAQVGEGYMTTLVRVASGVESAKVAMSALGMTAISYTDIINKQGDVTTEIERQTIVGAQTVTTATTELINRTEGLAPQLRTVTTSVVSGIGQIIQSFTGSATDLVTLYQSLLTIQGMMNDTALNGQNLTASTIQGAGGTSNLNTGLANYLKDYFSPAEQSTAELKDLNTQFVALGLVMPTTKAGFRDLVSGIDTSTSAGQKLLGKLLSLSGAFSDAMDHAAALTTATTSAATAMTAITQQMDQVRTLSKSIDGSIQTVAQNTPGYDMGGHLAGNVTSAQTALDDLSGGSLNDRISAAGTLQTAIMASYNYQYSALQTQVQAEQSAYQAGQQAAAQLAQTFKSIGNYAQSLLTSTLSPLSDQQKLAQAQAQYQDTLNKAQGGDATAAQALQGDANTYLTASRSYYASGSQYNDIFNNVQQALSALGSSGSNSLASVTQSGFQMSAELQQKMNDLQTQTNTQLTALKTLTDKWQSDLQASLDAQAAAVVAIPTALAALSTSLSTLDVRIGNAVAAAIAAKAIATAKTTSTGATTVDGSHATGLASVPFDGYRAELHQGEAVIDAPAMAAMRRYFNAPAPVSTGGGDNGATVAELREQNRHLQALVALHSAGYQALLVRLDKSNVALDGIKKKAVLAAAK